MKLGDKLIKNQDEYIKELQALLRQKEEENALLRKDISNKEIEYKSQISELSKSKKELLSSNNKLKIENDRALKAIKKSDNRINKLEKEKEKMQGELKAAHAQLEIIIDHLVSAQLMTRKAIEELYGTSSEKSSQLFNKKKSEDKKVDIEKEKTTHSGGRKIGTQNLGDWVFDCYDKITDDCELPLECSDPKQPNEVGKLISERTIQKIVVPKTRLQMAYKKVGIYQRRDGTTFEVIFDDKDPFGFSACTPSLASYLTYLKCALYLPNDRIEHMFKVQGTPISKQLQLSYLVKTSELFNIAFEKMHADLLSNDVLHADETTFNNLGAIENKTNYVWSLSTARSEPNQAVCYFYKDNRKYENAEQILQNFKGVIVSDRYQAYEIEGIANAFCWCHARRKYTDIIKHLNEGTEEYETLKFLIEKINKIFSLENSYTKLKITGADLIKKRQDEVKPVVDEYFEKIKSLVKKDSQTEMNIAFNYSINGEAGLRLFLNNPIIDASNNLAENMMRKVAKIRDNSLFSATTKGANATMTLLSIVQTCILNLVNPEKYIKYYLENYKNINEANIDNYLPYSKSLPKELYFSKKDIEQMKEATK